MTRRSKDREESEAQGKLAEARAGAARMTMKTAAGQPEEVVRARLQSEYTRAGLEVDEEFETLVAEIVAAPA